MSAEEESPVEIAQEGCCRGIGQALLRSLSAILNHFAPDLYSVYGYSMCNPCNWCNSKETVKRDYNFGLSDPGPNAYHHVQLSRSSKDIGSELEHYAAGTVTYSIPYRFCYGGELYCLRSETMENIQAKRHNNWIINEGRRHVIIEIDMEEVQKDVDVSLRRNKSLIRDRVEGRIFDELNWLRKAIRGHRCAYFCLPGFSHDDVFIETVAQLLINSYNYAPQDKKEVSLPLGGDCLFVTVANKGIMTVVGSKGRNKVVV